MRKAVVSNQVAHADPCLSDFCSVRHNPAEPLFHFDIVATGPHREVHGCVWHESAEWMRLIYMPGRLELTEKF